MDRFSNNSSPKGSNNGSLTVGKTVAQIVALAVVITQKQSIVIT